MHRSCRAPRAALTGSPHGRDGRGGRRGRRRHGRRRRVAGVVVGAYLADEGVAVGAGDRVPGREGGVGWGVGWVGRWGGGGVRGYITLMCSSPSPGALARDLVIVGGTEHLGRAVSKKVGVLVGRVGGWWRVRWCRAGEQGVALVCTAGPAHPTPGMGGSRRHSRPSCPARRCSSGGRTEAYQAQQPSAHTCCDQHTSDPGRCLAGVRTALVWGRPARINVIVAISTHKWWYGSFVYGSPAMCGEFRTWMPPVDVQGVPAAVELGGVAG